ncbi:MAG: RnfH family protein [Acidiferrobacterales bacterium]|nr:RnfH family protein [Acidiferrobacterales bacterium]
MFQVEVVYATPDEQTIIELQVPSSATIRDAIELSGILDRFPDLEISDDNVGIFAYRHPLDHLLNDGDRVEIYRPLLMSPTEARRIRAAAKATKQG